MKRREPVVADYMTPTPHSIAADQPISRARELMRQHRIRHVPVLQAGRLVGIVTDRDLAWFESFHEEQRASVLVEDVMTPFPYVASPSTPLRDVAEQMAAGKFGAVVVAEGTRTVGVFTTTDAMRALADALESRSASKVRAA